MPNHIKNRLKINADNEQVQEILKTIKSEEHGLGSIDFEKIIPMPPELDVEKSSYSRKALEFYSQYSKFENGSKFANKLIKEYNADDKMIEFGKLLYENKQKYGHTDWYDWSVANWGTKRNGYGFDRVEYQGGNEIEFETAWSRPEPIIKRLSEMFPDIGFKHQWADEDIGCNVGEVTYFNGAETEYDIPTAFAKEAYEMAANIQGMPLVEWGLYYNDEKGNYEWRDEDEIEETIGMGGM